MGRRSRRRRREGAAGGEPGAEPTTDYADAEGNVLTLRNAVSTGTLAKLRERTGGAAATPDDVWRRRTEMLFERYAVRWTIAGLPLTKQQELLGRYRMADRETQAWVRRTLDEHVGDA